MNINYGQCNKMSDVNPNDLQQTNVLCRRPYGCPICLNNITVLIYFLFLATIEFCLACWMSNVPNRMQTSFKKENFILLPLCLTHARFKA